MVPPQSPWLHESDGGEVITDEKFWGRGHPPGHFPTLEPGADPEDIVPLSALSLPATWWCPKWEG